MWGFGVKRDVCPCPCLRGSHVCIYLCVNLSSNARAGIFRRLPNCICLDVCSGGGCLKEKEGAWEHTDKQKGGLFSCLSANSKLRAFLGGCESRAAVQPTIHGMNKGLLHG